MGDFTHEVCYPNPCLNFKHKPNLDRNRNPIYRKQTKQLSLSLQKLLKRDVLYVTISNHAFGIVESGINIGV
jgi:hypothetical protein